MPPRLPDVGDSIIEYIIGLALIAGFVFLSVPIIIVSTMITVLTIWFGSIYACFRICIWVAKQFYLAVRHNIWGPQAWPQSRKVKRRWNSHHDRRLSASATSQRKIVTPRSRRQSHSRMDSVTETTTATPGSETFSRADTIASFASNEDRDFGDMGGWAGPNEDNEALYMARHTQAFAGPVAAYTQSPTQHTPTRSRSGSLDGSPILSRSSSRAPITSEYSGFQDEMRPRSMSNSQPPVRQVNTPYGPQTPSREGTFNFGSDGSASFSAGGSTTPTFHESRSQVTLNERQSRSRRSSVHRRSANLSTTSLGSVPEGRTMGDQGTPIGSPPMDEDGLRALRNVLRSESVR